MSLWMTRPKKAALFFSAAIISILRKASDAVWGVYEWFGQNSLKSSHGQRLHCALICTNPVHSMWVSSVAMTVTASFWQS